jgi:hypothetical protein
LGENKEMKESRKKHELHFVEDTGRFGKTEGQNNVKKQKVLFPVDFKLEKYKMVMVIRERGHSLLF